MPLYKSRIRKSYASQSTQNNEEQPEEKIVKISSDLHGGTSSQTAIADILHINKIVRSPIYPEVLPRTASEPKESAFLESEFFDENKDDTKFTGETFPSSTGKTLHAVSNEQYLADSNSIEVDPNSSAETVTKNLTTEKNGKHKTENEKKSKHVNQKKPRIKSQKNSILSNEPIRKSSHQSVKENNSDYRSIHEPCPIKNQNNEKLSQTLNASHKSSIHSLDLSLSDRQSCSFLNVSSNQSLNDSGRESSFNNFPLSEKKGKSKNGPLLSQKSDISMSDPAVKNAYMQFMKKNEKFCRIATPKGLEHDQQLKWLQQQRNVGVYVHCDKCDKIRYLDDVKDPLLLPKKWYCQNNPDKVYNTCEKPEEKFPVHIQEDWIDNLYNAGSIVWAHVEGYPWWPGIVDDDPNTECYYWLDDEFNNTPSYYHVTFFDDKEVTRAWLKPAAITPFTEEMGNTRHIPQVFSSYRARIDVAIKQAKEASKMPLLTRLEKFSFLARYKKPIKKPKDINSNVKNNKLKKGDVILHTTKTGKLNKISENRNKNTVTKTNKKNNKQKKLKKGTLPYDSTGLFDDFEIPSNPSIDDISLELFDDF